MADGPSPRASIADMSEKRPSSGNHHVPAEGTRANIDSEQGTISQVDLETNKADDAPVRDGTRPQDFPDGGLEAWLVVLGASCALFASFGWINCIGVFQEYYQLHLLNTYSSSTIAWITSLEVFMMFAGGPWFGKVSDGYGPRYLILGGTFFHVFGLMMTSLATQYYQVLLAQGVCSAIGASALFYGATNATGTWFFKKRATAFGIVTAGSSLGGVIMPIMVQRLIPQIGFGWTMRTMAFMLLGMCMVAVATVKSRLTPRPTKLRLMDFIKPLNEPAFLFLCLGIGIFTFGTFLPFNYVILEALRDGMSENLSSYLPSILNAASIFGRILPGIIADRVGRFNVTILMTTVSSILVLALWLPTDSNAPIIAFTLLYGFTSGAIVSMAPSLVAQISPIRELGIRNGTLFMFASVSALTGSPIGGALVSLNKGDFTYLQVFCGVAMSVGTVFYVASRVVQRGLKVVAV